MRRTIATICSGAGLIEAGAVEAGYQPIWGIENDKEVAELHKLNFPNSKIYNWDARKIGARRWRSLEVPDLLHISPPCQQFSLANSELRGETNDDKAIATSFCNAILTLRPPTITIENVSCYQHSKSWQLMQSALFTAGYYVATGDFNSVDWGVPQDRTRFMAIAQLDKLVCSIIPPFRRVTIAESLSDLIGALPSSNLTNGQLNKLKPKDRLRIDSILSYESDEMALISRIGIRKHTLVRYGNEASFCILAKIATDHKGSSRESFINLVYRGKTYSLNARAIARLMSLPDWYDFGDFPNKTTISGLGNGVCPELYKQLIQSV